MLRFGFYIGCFVCLLSSCSEGPKTVDNEKTTDPKPFLFRMNAVFTDSEKYLSFPVWFNDSIIAQNKITKITRSLFFVEVEDSNETIDVLKDIPREKTEYWFYPNGQISKLKVTYYYDDEEIGNVSFIYKTLKDRNGFATVLRSDDQLQYLDMEDTEMDFPFKIHQLDKKTKKYLAYQDDETGDYLFFMLNKKYWGPLSVDSILNPMPKDIIILGSPFYPVKQYRVRNKVNEMDVQEITYYPNGKSVNTIIRHEYPFERRRSVQYDQKGICTGYIDSTFSGKLFLTRTLNDMTLDKSNKPTRITHKKENQLDKTARISIELLTYEY